MTSNYESWKATDNTKSQGLTGDQNNTGAFKPGVDKTTLDTTFDKDLKTGPHHQLHGDSELLPSTTAGGHTVDYSADKMNSVRLPASEEGDTQFNTHHTSKTQPGYGVSPFESEADPSFKPTNTFGADTDKQFGGSTGNHHSLSSGTGTGTGHHLGDNTSKLGPSAGFTSQQGTDKTFGTGTGQNLGDNTSKFGPSSGITSQYGTDNTTGTGTGHHLGDNTSKLGPSSGITSQHGTSTTTAFPDSTSGQATHFQNSLAGQKVGLNDEHKSGQTQPGQTHNTMRNTTEEHTGPHPNITPQRPKDNATSGTTDHTHVKPTTAHTDHTHNKTTTANTDHTHNKPTTTNTDHTHDKPTTGKPSVTDKMIGKTEQVVGKVTRDHGLEEKGAQRAQHGVQKN